MGFCMKARVRVWDLPTRLFHWALVISVVALFVTGNVGGLWIEWHYRLGQLVFSLLLFRLLWGFWGGHWSRFVNFVRGPFHIWRYWRGQTPPAVGHNPLGAWSVLAFFGVLLAQVFTGLISDDEIAFYGPWSPLLSSDWVSWATHYHQNIGKFLLLALVVMHLLAMAFYAWVRRKPLVPAMIHGDKLLSPLTTASSDTTARRFWALLLWFACVGLVLLTTPLPG
jgi:cytochrome b